MKFDIGTIWHKAPLDIRNIMNAMFFGTSARIKFYKKMASFTRGSGAIVDIFGLLINSAKRNKRSYLYVFENTQKRLREGNTFHDSLSPHIPDSDKAILVTGEKSGNLSDVFERLANSLEKIKNMTSKAYMSATLLIAYFSLVLYILSTIATQISDLMSDMINFATNSNEGSLVFSSSALSYVSMGEYLTNYGVVTAIVLALLVLFIVITLPKWSGKIRDKVHRFLLPWSVYRSFVVAKFFLALASLLKSGLVLKDSLKIIKANANPYLAYYIDKMIQVYSTTSNARETFQSQLYDAETNDELSFYMSNTENLDQAVDDMAEEQLSNANIAINRASAISSAFIFILVVGVVAWSGATIFEIADVIKKSAQG